MNTATNALIQAVDSALESLAEEVEQRKASFDSEYFGALDRVATRLAEAVAPLRSGRVEVVDLSEEMLRRFPELGTDDEMNGGDTVEELCRWFEELRPDGDGPAPAAGSDAPDHSEPLIAQARLLYASPEKGIEVDDDAELSVADDASWVQAWVRVPAQGGDQEAA